jgi:SET domain-containing protein
MRTETDHQSFILKPSTISGIGVFLLHNVAKGTHLELFREDFQEELRGEKDVSEELQGFCLDHESGKLLCPKFFNRMDIGNYVNHSHDANMRYEKGKGYFAKRDIKAGEELLADYRELPEPESTWEEYYR